MLPKQKSLILYVSHHILCHLGNRCSNYFSPKMSSKFYPYFDRNEVKNVKVFITLKTSKILDFKIRLRGTMEDSLMISSTL